MKKKRITRDNFDAFEVLTILRATNSRDCDDIPRLLEEACQYIIRQQVKIDTFQRKAAELHTALGGKR